MWVLDASVALRWFIEEEAHPRAEEILERIIDEPTLFAVPELFPFEVFSVLMRLHPKAEETYRETVIPLLQTGILRHPMTDELARDAVHFVRMGLTGYDACYASLARSLGALWLTYDERAHQKIRQENVSWCVVGKLPLDW